MGTRTQGPQPLAVVWLQPVGLSTWSSILAFSFFDCGISLIQFAISGETESFGSNNLMGQWLKSIGGYTVEQIGSVLHLTIVFLGANHVFADKPDFYPSGATAVAIASTLVCATWTDHTCARWPVLVYMSVACIIAAICILVWSSPIGLKFFAYCAFKFLLANGEERFLTPTKKISQVHRLQDRLLLLRLFCSV